MPTSEIPLGSELVVVIVASGYPDVVTGKLRGAIARLVGPAASVVTEFALVNFGVATTVSLKVCVALSKEFFALIVKMYSPLVPAIGTPRSSAEPAPLA